jgi:hypothetical protein
MIGISSKYIFEWKHQVVKFKTNEVAEKWLNTEEYDFRERRLFSTEKEARKFLKGSMPANKIKYIFEMADICYINENGKLDFEFWGF